MTEKEMLMFFLPGEPIGLGKNNIGITKQGIRYPSKGFVRWKRSAAIQIRDQIGYPTMITMPVHITVIYTPKNKRVRDSTAILDGVYHLLEELKIIKNDSQIKSIKYGESMVDANHCGIYVELYLAGQSSIEWI